MKRHSRDDIIYNRLKNVFTSYALMNWYNVNTPLDVLKGFIQQTENIDIDINELNEYISKTKSQLEVPYEISKSKAVLITKDKDFQIIKFGSDYCPKCNKFKNYLKICPHCDYIEFNN
ncbi:MAG: hypothetical protein JSV49_07995 [Thermoplasmata archaeon]|nr:MAG: hypothetical protein JSV49_07995 [Thermoplasmata archaeon]